jgi:hypothetical protein
MARPFMIILIASGLERVNRKMSDAGSESLPASLTAYAIGNFTVELPSSTRLTTVHDLENLPEARKELHPQG